MNANQNNAAQAAKQEIDAIMEEAQAFASAWSLIGGRFDDGNMAENAQQSKQRLFEMVSKLRAPVAAPSDETLRLAGVIADKIEDGTLFQAGIFSRRELADKVRTLVQFVRGASAPVAGEPAYYAVMHGQALYGIFDSEAAAEECKEQGHPDAPFSVKPLYAVPQASAEDVHNAALEEAAHLMEQTGKRIAASDIRALKTQAGKDGCQKRAVDVDLYGLAIECGAVISTDDLSWTFSYSAMRNFCIRVRAALSAPQAEQGERE